MKNKILIIGHSPAKKNILKSPTMKRLHRWMDECGIDFYGFTNLCYEPKAKLKEEDIFLTDMSGHRIIALGGFVSKYLNKLGVEHFAAPHPSPLNRNLNDKSFENKIINELKVYIDPTL